MDIRFNDLFSRPENQIFHVVFFPDRVYHAQYLNATRSPRYRYNVMEVRSKVDAQILKGEVFLDDRKLCNFMRIEYRGSRLVEVVRERGRFLRQQLVAWVNVLPDDPQFNAESRVKLTYCPWIDAFQVELWETLETPDNLRHDIKVLDLMGREGSITRIPAFTGALRDIRALRRIEVAFRENTVDHPSGYTVTEEQAAWDNFYGRNIQVPNSQEPSSPANTVDAANYFLDFRRGSFVADATQLAPVRYRNAMMNDDDAERFDDNIIEMRWILQREFGGTVVFFHEVTIPPGKVEGTHRHIGSEELYFITEGEGIAYMGLNDDPSLEEHPVVQRQIYGLDPEDCREVPVKPGTVIFTKSGGIHGIRNPNDRPLKFVAFLYHGT